MDSTREALESALAAMPEDVALHSAYADWLIEDGDPRGEYIRLQLSLEDRDQPLERLRELTQAAYRLRQEYEAEWLGPLNLYVNPPREGRSVVEPMEPNIQVSFRRGWLDRVVIQSLDPMLLRAVALCPVGRLLREFECVRSQRRRINPHPELPRPNWPNLRILRLGTQGAIWHGSEADLWPELRDLEVLELCSECEDLDQLFAMPWPRLRQLLLRTGPQAWRLEYLARNPALGNLETLDLRKIRSTRDSQGDQGPSFTGLLELGESPYLTKLSHLTIQCEDLRDRDFLLLLRSPLMDRLRTLRLNYCGLTDAIIEPLLSRRFHQNLELVELRGNAISIQGAVQLLDHGIQINEIYVSPRPIEEPE